MIDAPECGTPEYNWWRKGAEQEHVLAVEGMTKDGKEIYEYVQIIAQQGRSRDAIVTSTVFVFTADWSKWQRFRLMWDMLWSNATDRISVYFDLRDWWFGYYRGKDHHYVCPVPTLVVRWPRRKKGQS